MVEFSRFPASLAMAAEIYGNLETAVRAAGESDLAAIFEASNEPNEAVGCLCQAVPVAGSVSMAAGQRTRKRSIWASRAKNSRQTTSVSIGSLLQSTLPAGSNRRWQHKLPIR